MDKSTEDKIRNRAASHIRKGYLQACYWYHTDAQSPPHDRHQVSNRLEDLKDTLSLPYLIDATQAFGFAGLLDCSDFHFYRLGIALFADDNPNFTYPCLKAPEIISPLDKNGPDLLTAVGQGRNRMPDHIRQVFALGRKHNHTTLARRMTDYNENLAARKATGYMGYTINYSPAYCAPGVEINIRQEHRSLYSGGEYIHSKNPVRLYLHECGHELDFIINHFSGSDDFKHAYQKDINYISSLPQQGAISKRFRQQVHAGTGITFDEVWPWGYEKTQPAIAINQGYYLHRDLGGRHDVAYIARKEAFAESFYTAISGEEFYDGFTEIFACSFQAVDMLLQSLAFEMNRTPDPKAAFETSVYTEIPNPDRQQQTPPAP